MWQGSLCKKEFIKELACRESISVFDSVIHEMNLTRSEMRKYCLSMEFLPSKKQTIKHQSGKNSLIHLDGLCRIRSDGRK
jgi:hypothetical protein